MSQCRASVEPVSRGGRRRARLGRHFRSVTRPRILARAPRRSSLSTDTRETSLVPRGTTCRRLTERTVACFPVVGRRPRILHSPAPRAIVCLTHVPTALPRVWTPLNERCVVSRCGTRRAIHPHASLRHRHFRSRVRDNPHASPHDSRSCARRYLVERGRDADERVEVALERVVERVAEALPDGRARRAAAERGLGRLAPAVEELGAPQRRPTVTFGRGVKPFGRGVKPPPPSVARRVLSSRLTSVPSGL